MFNFLFATKGSQCGSESSEPKPGQWTPGIGQRGQDSPPLACQGIILEIDNDGMRHAAVPKEWLQSAGLFTMCV